MKYLLFLFAHFVAAQDVIPVEFNDLVGKMAMGPGVICTITDGGLRCWGEKERLMVNPRGLRNVRQVSVSNQFIYVLDDDGIKQWRRGDDYFFYPQPGLKNPRQISAAGDYACALDNKDVKCWGANWGPLPKFNDPQQVSVGPNYACALDENIAKCWGPLSDESVTPTVEFPSQQIKQVSVGTYSICLLAVSGRAFCQGVAGGPSNIDWPKSREEIFVQISVGDRICGLTNQNQVDCATDAQPSQLGIDERVRGARLVISGPSDSFCVAGRNGVWCQGEGFTEVPWPAPRNVNQISLQEDYICLRSGADSSGKGGHVECHGNDRYGQANTSVDLKTDSIPIHLWNGLSSFMATAKSYACSGPVSTSDENRSFCWGQVPKYEASLDLRSGTQLAVGDTFACLIRNNGGDGIECTGPVNFVIEMRNLDRTLPAVWGFVPIHLVAHGDTICVTIDPGLDISTLHTKLFCLNTDGTSIQKTLSNWMPAPYTLSMIDNHTVCATDLHQVLCLDIRSTSPPFVRENLPTGTTAVDMHKEATCVATDKGLSCTGPYQPVIDDRPFVMATTLTGLIDFSAASIAESLRLMTRVSANTRRMFFAEIAAYLDYEKEDSARETIVRLLEPSIVSGDSAIFIDTLIPRYLKTRPGGEKQTRIAMTTTQVGQRHAALKTMQAALSIAQNFYSEEDRAHFTELLRVLSRLQAQDTAGVKDFVLRIDQETPRLENLSRSPKSAFLYDTIQLSKEWLRKVAD